MHLQRFHDVPIEVVRGFWDSRPCNIRHSPKPVGTREYFEEVTARKYFVEPHIPRFAQFERWCGKRVLEIGCGIWTDTISFAQAAAQVTAVDVSDRSLAIARQRAEVYGFDDVRFYCANAEELTKLVPVQPYDLVYSYGVIHHTRRPEHVIGQIRILCAPGKHAKNHGLPPLRVEGPADLADLRKRSILAVS